MLELSLVIMLILLREFASVALVGMSMIKMLRARWRLVVQVFLWLIPNSWGVPNVLLEYQHDLFAYDVVWFSNIFLREFILIDLAYAHAYSRL